MASRRRDNARFYRDKDWKPPYDLVIPPDYPAQYIPAPPSYSPTPGNHSTLSFQLAPTPSFPHSQHHPFAWATQPAYSPQYFWAPNMQPLPSYQAVAAPQSSAAMLVTPAGAVPNAPMMQYRFGTPQCYIFAPGSPFQARF